jgi:hypothetical protein
MEVVIDYEFQKGQQGEVVIKELSKAAQDVLHKIHFRSPYSTRPHGSENRLNWDYGIVPYQLDTALRDVVAGYAHL